MAEPVSLQTLLTYLTPISIPVGVIYHIMTLRNTRKNKQPQLKTSAQLIQAPPRGIPYKHVRTLLIP